MSKYLLESQWSALISVGMTIKETAQCLAELGNETRLSLFRYLVKMGPRAIPVGHIQKELDVPASTLSHHIARLSNVGLISQQRDGRILYCSPRYEKLQSLIDFLVDECCQGKTCEIITKKSCC